MIKVENIVKRFGTLEVLRGVSLEIGSGEIVGIVGPSGAGKTTLLQIVGTLDKPDGGRVLYDGTDVLQLKGIGPFSQPQHRFCVSIPPVVARVHVAGECGNPCTDRWREARCGL